MAVLVERHRKASSLSQVFAPPHSTGQFGAWIVRGSTRLTIGFFLALVALVPLRADALSVPPLTGHVNDYGGMISKPTAVQLDSDLVRLEETDSTQIVVLTVPSLEGESLEEFSLKVVEAWKIGQKGVDNGALLLITRDERKVRIEVGRGLEGKLTDLVAGRIVRNRIVPKFRAGDMDGGVSDGVRAITEVVKGEYQAGKRDLAQGRKSVTPPILTLLLFLFVALVFAGALSKFFGAATGAVGLPVVAKLAFPSLSYPLIGGLGVLGIVVGLLLSAVFSGGGRPDRGGGGFWGSGLGGGPFLGGGSGSAGDFGGGFSGGGGDFGGGGASGDW